MRRVREKLNREMRSGLYTLVILSVVKRLGRTYGYEIQSYVERETHGRIKLKDATIYPVLRYLVKCGALSAQWSEPGKGVPRKYYSLTPSGEELFRSLVSDYRALIDDINSLVGDAL